MEEFNIILAGVGGQGTVLASEILGTAAVMAGFNVQESEVLGMSQRGGAVVSHIRFGSKVYGPIVPDGKGDVLVALEISEALRNITLLSRQGLSIVNTRPIIPYTVSIGISKYPSLEEIMERLTKYARVIAIDATELAGKAGNVVAVNTVMLGALAGSGRFPIGRETILKAIEARVNKNVVQVNRKAFMLGYEEVRSTSRAGRIENLSPQAQTHGRSP